MHESTRGARPRDSSSRSAGGSLRLCACVYQAERSEKKAGSHFSSVRRRTPHSIAHRPSIRCCQLYYDVDGYYTSRARCVSGISLEQCARLRTHGPPHSRLLQGGEPPNFEASLVDSVAFRRHPQSKQPASIFREHIHRDASLLRIGPVRGFRACVGEKATG